MSEVTAASALEPDYLKGRFGATDVTTPGVVLRELHFRAIVQVEMRKMSDALWPALGLSASPAAGGSISGPDFAVHWAGPGRWLCFSERLSAEELEQRIVAVTAAASVSTNDLSHARTVIHVSGPDAVELLSKGCFIDFDGFANGATALTRLSHFSVHLRRLDNAVELSVMRSLARSLWRWLLDAAGEFGYRVD